MLPHPIIHILCYPMRFFSLPYFHFISFHNLTNLSQLALSPQSIISFLSSILCMISSHLISVTHVLCFSDDEAVLIFERTLATARKTATPGNILLGTLLRCLRTSSIFPKEEKDGSMHAEEKDILKDGRNRSLLHYYSISYHIISYHITSYRIILHHIITYHILIVSYYIISYHILSYHIILHHVISYHIISYNIISFYIVSYHIHGTVSYYIISYSIISYHTTLYQNISYYII